MFALRRLLEQAAQDLLAEWASLSRPLAGCRAAAAAFGPCCGLEALEPRIVPTLLGQQIFPVDNPWNQNIANAPVATNSAAVISNIGSER